MAYIRIIKGDRGGEVGQLKDKTVFGRHLQCDVVVDRNTVSKQHAQIVHGPDGWCVEDLDSRNGTFLNGERIPARSPQRLQNNDRIKLCDVLLTFHDEPAAARPKDRLAMTVAPAADDSQATIMSTLDATSTSTLRLAQAEVKLKAVFEVSQALSSTLEVDRLLPKILDNLFTMFPQADRGFILLCEDDPEHLIPKAVKHRRAEDEEAITYSRTVVRRAITERCAVLSADASADSRFSMAQSIADFRIRSMMCAPLMTQTGKPLGIIHIDTQNQRSRFTQEDLDLLNSVAVQAAIAMENASLHERLVAQARLEREMEFARQVQRGFLPARLPEAPGYEFFAHYDSAYRVGGDYYDFLRLPNDRLAVALGDVSGKGVPAALMMARLSSDVRFATLLAATPAEAVARLNDSLAQAGLEDRFVTFILVEIDLARHQAAIVNAGHMAPVLYRAAKGDMELLADAEAGLPLGVTDGVEFQAVHTALEPGDALVLFTDGVSEAMDPDGNLYTLERLYRLIRSTPATAQALGRTILDDLRRHAAGRAQSDDITLVCLGRTN